MSPSKPSTTPQNKQARQNLFRDLRLILCCEVCRQLISPSYLNAVCCCCYRGCCLCAAVVVVSRCCCDSWCHRWHTGSRLLILLTEPAVLHHAAPAPFTSLAGVPHIRPGSGALALAVTVRESLVWSRLGKITLAYHKEYSKFLKLSKFQKRSVAKRFMSHWQLPEHWISII